MVYYSSLHTVFYLTLSSSTSLPSSPEGVKPPTVQVTETQICLHDSQLVFYEKLDSPHVNRIVLHVSFCFPFSAGDVCLENI